MESDFVSVHVPLMPGTRHLIDDAAFGLMKKNGCFHQHIQRSRSG